MRRPNRLVPLRLVALVLVCVWALTVSAEESPVIPSLSASQVERLTDGEILVDVREGATPPEGEAIGVIRAPLMTVVDQMRDVESYEEWMSNLVSCDLISVVDGVYTYHGVTDAPWPVEDREWTVRATAEEVAIDGVDVVLMAFEYVPGSGNIVDTRGYYMFLPWGEDGDETLLVAHMALDAGTWLPDFVLEWAQETFAPAPVLNLRNRLGV